MTTWAKGYQQSKDLWLQRFGGKIKEEAPTKKIRGKVVRLINELSPIGGLKTNFKCTAKL